MAEYCRIPLEGELKEGDIYPLLYHIHKNIISGCLTVQQGDVKKQIVIEDGKILFASSNDRRDTFGRYLLAHRHIDAETHNKASQYMEQHHKRFGRALIALGHFNYQQLWTHLRDHLRGIVFSFFNFTTGTYRIQLGHQGVEENILLDMDILNLLLEGIRRFSSRPLLERVFNGLDNLYVINTAALAQLELKPYEAHVYQLVLRGSGLPDILRRSELLKWDTLRYLYLFMVLEIISPRPVAEGEEEPGGEREIGPGAHAFVSFDEALQYYNMKYETIYKVMLKEIGPIALSLLTRAVEGNMDHLPKFFRNMQFNPGGTLDRDALLPSFWYGDFEKHIGEFLRGLEEILHTEIHTVKKHLGDEYEQQVLRWINGIGT